MTDIKLKPGDKVTLEVVEISPLGQQFRTFFKVEEGKFCSTAWLIMDNIHVVSHEPAPEPPLKVGDKVKRNGDVGEILAICGDRGWVKLVDSELSPFTTKLDTWERVSVH